MCFWCDFKAPSGARTRLLGGKTFEIQIWHFFSFTLGSVWQSRFEQCSLGNSQTLHKLHECIRLRVSSTSIQAWQISRTPPAHSTEKFSLKSEKKENFRERVCVYTCGLESELNWYSWCRGWRNSRRYNDNDLRKIPFIRATWFVKWRGAVESFKESRSLPLEAYFSIKFSASTPTSHWPSSYRSWA